MNVRFIMYPAEIGMGPVYERLFNMEPISVRLQSSNCWAT